VNEYGNLSTDGTISAAGGNFEVDAAGGINAAGGEFTVNGINGTVTIGSDTDNQTIVTGGNFSSEATNGTAKILQIPMQIMLRDFDRYWNYLRDGSNCWWFAHFC
jgi:hypothetical protein